MPIFALDDDVIYFPPPEMADGSGILAIGGDLRPARVRLAYANGIFPWSDPDEELLWWAPDPRFVLFPENLKVSKSMRQLLRQRRFEVTFDRAFRQVMRNCQQAYRPGQSGTWISDEMIESFASLHEQGFAHSVEVWKEGELVGGLYGGCVGRNFFGESMFAHESNASKYGFVTLVKNLQKFSFLTIDCQVYTPHLESFGAEMISRAAFLDYLDEGATTSEFARSWDGLFATDFSF